MKEIPILFSTEMVKAVLEGRKTQTRRLAAVPNHIHHGTNIMDWPLSKHPEKIDGKWYYNVQDDVDSHYRHELKCRWQVGDHLWVRETIYEHGHYYTGSFDETDEYETRFITQGKISYVATDEKPSRCRTVPSIHMHKKYARIWLEVTDIRVERLQDISEEDSKAEGVQENKCESNEGCPSVFCKERCAAEGEYFRYSRPMNFDLDPCESAKESFKSLWQSINGEQSWKENPFVWVISFTPFPLTGEGDKKNRV